MDVPSQRPIPTIVPSWLHTCQTLYRSWMGSCVCLFLHTALCDWKHPRDQIHIFWCGTHPLPPSRPITRAERLAAYEQYPDCAPRVAPRGGTSSAVSSSMSSVLTGAMDALGVTAEGPGEFADAPRSSQEEGGVWAVRVLMLVHLFTDMCCFTSLATDC